MSNYRQVARDVNPSNDLSHKFPSHHEKVVGLGSSCDLECYHPKKPKLLTSFESEKYRQNQLQNVRKKPNFEYESRIQEPRKRNQINLVTNWKFLPHDKQEKFQNIKPQKESQKPHQRNEIEKKENQLSSLKEHKAPFDRRFSFKTSGDLIQGAYEKIQNSQNTRLKTESYFTEKKCLTTVTSVDKLYLVKKKQNLKAENAETFQVATDKKILPLFLKGKRKKSQKMIQQQIQTKEITKQEKNQGKYFFKKKNMTRKKLFSNKQLSLKKNLSLSKMSPFKDNYLRKKESNQEIPTTNKKNKVLFTQLKVKAEDRKIKKVNSNDKQKCSFFLNSHLIFSAPFSPTTKISRVSPSPNKTSKLLFSKTLCQDQRRMSGVSSSNVDSNMFDRLFAYQDLLSLKNVVDPKGQQIRLEVLRVLMDNKNTVTYLVRQLRTSFLFCLKKFSTGFKQNCQEKSNRLKKIIREARISLSLSHPNIVKTYAILCDDTNIYLLMQFMNEGNLDKQIAQKQKNKGPQSRNKLLDFSQSSIPNLQKIYKDRKRHQQLLKIYKKIQICSFLFQILQGLNYLHERGIIHRDIKPANILLTQKTCLKLADFGSTVKDKRNAEYAGSLDYIAPEMLSKQQYDTSVDMWALGCVAYELAIGKPPFYDSSQKETMQRILKCEYELCDIQDEGLKDFIRKLLIKQKNERMVCKQALKHEFIIRNQLTNEDEINEELIAQALEAEQQLSQNSDDEIHL